MNSSLLIVVIVASLVQLGQLQPGPATVPTTKGTVAPTTKAAAPVTAGPTTQTPPTTAKPVTSAPKPQGTTFKDISDRLSTDPKLNSLTQQVAKIQIEIQTIEKVFEMDIVFRNITQLNEVLKQVKVVRQQTTFILAEIHSEIASVPIRSFLFRLLQESLRIQTEKFDRLLKWIGLEILGDLSDVSRFENYYYSETVSIAEQLLATRLLDVLLEAYEADKLLDDAWKKDPLHGKIDAETKKKVDQYFHQIITNANAAKTEIAADYYEELEKIRLDNRELNLLQRMNAEMYIDALNYAISFVTKYDQLFLRIN